MIATLGRWTRVVLSCALLSIAAPSCSDDSFPAGCMKDWTCTSLTLAQCEAIILIECNADESSFQDGTCTLLDCGGANGCIFNPCGSDE